MENAIKVDINDLLDQHLDMEGGENTKENNTESGLLPEPDTPTNEASCQAITGQKNIKKI